MHNVYMISDMHFGHANIIKYENRPFRSVEEMDESIIKNWNSKIKAEDFVLGDVSFYSKEKTKEIIDKLNGVKILILGNHDNNKRVQCWYDIGFSEVYKYPIIYDNFYILSHEPVYLNENMPYANIHGHIHHLKYDSGQFFNVSVECINYSPIKFEDIKEKILE